MDENSCEGETSESAGNVLDGQRAKKTDDVSQLENVGVRIDLKGKKTVAQVSERCGSSVDASASGPSSFSPTVELEGDGEIEEALSAQELSESVSESLQTNDNASDSQSFPAADVEPEDETQARTAHNVEEQLVTRAVTVGPPPSYSFVMKQKKKSSKPVLSDSIVTDRPPPPTYSGNRGLCLPPEESRLERICNLPSLSEPLWRSHSQPALCPRCGIIILTTIHSHDSIATHVAALALCLFGCWPCCLLPYCMNVCKNTYHHCPICQSFLGAYSPW